MPKRNIALEILDVQFPCNDLDEESISVREYLKTLLLTLFYEGEGFSGKRPFGNSGWEHDLKNALVKSGHINGRIEDECLEEFDGEAFEKKMELAIRSL